MGDERPPDRPEDDATTESQHTESGSAQRIGFFRILQKIGEGGMGEVYLAEQERPFRRRVALKIIKRGMDTKQVVARFEAERQALAIMDHPNIARVFDAGETPDGRPHFVMEYVKGEPITDYSDRQRLTIKERLQLFMQACEGVQHAHHKAVIHRDLKPSNILVTVIDGRPIVKIIDFGVAKAIDQRLTERTLFTELGMMVGTPEYMSPEQAETSSLPVDARTDVYSLGVVLYELLAGALPFESRRLRQAGYQEMQRIIREEDPPTPSVRLSRLGGNVSDVALQRQTDSASLRRTLRGNLDRVVMRAMAKDATRRYPSAEELGRDLERYLQGQPVVGGPKRVWDLTLPQLGTVVVIGLAVGLLGVLLESWPRTATLEARALDLLFRVRGPRPPPRDVCVIAIDEASYQAFDLDIKQLLPRLRHAELLAILTREGAKAVAYDVLFLSAGDADQDAAFSRSVADAGRVVLGATSDGETVIGPLEEFSRAAVAVADVQLPAQLDGVIRAVPLMSKNRPGLALAAYEIATRDDSRRGSSDPHWIDWYGPSRTIPTVSLHHALDPQKHLPPGFFRDKLVFVGLAQPSTLWDDDAITQEGLMTPWGARGTGEFYGVEIHATVAANLMENRRIERVSRPVRVLLLVSVPLLTALAMARWRPITGAMVWVGIASVLLAAGYAAFAGIQVWLNLVVPVVVQLPIAGASVLVWRNRHRRFP